MSLTGSQQRYIMELGITRKAKLCIYYLRMSVFLKGVTYLIALAVPCLWNAFLTNGGEENTHSFKGPRSNRRRRLRP